MHSFAKEIEMLSQNENICGVPDQVKIVIAKPSRH
jgi:hypothetical protein